MKSFVPILLIVAALAGFAYGFYAAKHGAFPAGVVASLFGASDDERDRPRRNRHARGNERPRELRGLAYLPGYEKAPEKRTERSGHAANAYDGYNFVCSAHGPVLALMDMKGRVLHEWVRPYHTVRDWHRGEHANPDWPPPDHWSARYFRRAHLFPNGDVLAIYEDVGLIKLDHASNVLWAYGERAHHAVTVDGDGNILVLTRDLKRMDLPTQSIELTKPVYDDCVDVLHPATGKLLTRVSITECFLNSAFVSILEHVKKEDDIFHTNAIQWIDGRHADRVPILKRGRVLVSLRNVNTIALLDLEARKVVWTQTGLWYWQHEPRVLDNGNFLVFDNNGNGGKSKVIEFDPMTQEIVWTYEGSKGHDFHSSLCGTVYRLPNGNTLVCESTRGRAVEVTTAGEIVWSWDSPYRLGNGVVPVLHDVVRIDKSSVRFKFNRVE